MAFTEQFPPMLVYQGKVPLAEYYYGSTDGVPHRYVALEEMLLLWLANQNPSFSPFEELFVDQQLRNETAYTEVVGQLSEFFKGQPNFGQLNQDLASILESPAKHAPHSLTGTTTVYR